MNLKRKQSAQTRRLETNSRGQARTTDDDGKEGSTVSQNPVENVYSRARGTPRYQCFLFVLFF